MRISIPGIEPNRLDQRLIFLQDRVKAHLSAIEESSGTNGQRAILERACAATLLRDAACIALLLGKMDNARHLLLQAGRHFLALGLPAGAGLVALANIDQTAEELSAYEDVLQAARKQWRPEETRRREDRRGSISEQARSEPRQLLGIIQADWLMALSGQISRTSVGTEAMRIALGRAGGYAAGATGLSIDSYLHLADEFVKRPDGNLSEQTWIGRSLSTLYAVRSENLQTAQKDEFHWRMLPRPAELVDLDATILMVLALGTDLAKDLQEWADERDSSLLDAPLHIAEALRGEQNYTHSL